MSLAIMRCYSYIDMLSHVDHDLVVQRATLDNLTLPQSAIAVNNPHEQFLGIDEVRVGDGSLCAGHTADYGSRSTEQSTAEQETTERCTSAGTGVGYLGGIAVQVQHADHMGIAVGTGHAEIHTGMVLVQRFDEQIPPVIVCQSVEARPDFAFLVVLLHIECDLPQLLGGGTDFTRHHAMDRVYAIDLAHGNRSPLDDSHRFLGIRRNDEAVGRVSLEVIGCTVRLLVGFDFLADRTELPRLLHDKPHEEETRDPQDNAHGYDCNKRRHGDDAEHHRQEPPQDERILHPFVLGHIISILDIFSVHDETSFTRAYQLLLLIPNALQHSSTVN